MGKTNFQPFKSSSQIWIVRVIISARFSDVLFRNETTGCFATRELVQFSSFHTFSLKDVAQTLFRQNFIYEERRKLILISIFGVAKCHLFSQAEITERKCSLPHGRGSFFYWSYLPARCAGSIQGTALSIDDIMV